MDEFDNIKSGSGLLKDNYGNGGVSDALKKKRQKMADDRGIVPPDDEKEDDSDLGAMINRKIKQRLGG